MPDVPDKVSQEQYIERHTHGRRGRETGEARGCLLQHCPECPAFLYLFDSSSKKEKEKQQLRPEKVSRTTTPLPSGGCPARPAFTATLPRLPPEGRLPCVEGTMDSSGVPGVEFVEFVEFFFGPTHIKHVRAHTLWREKVCV